MKTVVCVFQPAD